MAEQPNYLSEINRARQQTRQGRRRRTDSVVDSMDSAAAMDRMQGVDVGGFTTSDVDVPQMNILPAVARGGSSAPIRTAVDTGDSGAAITTVGTCPGGVCRPRGMSLPTASTTIVTAPAGPPSVKRSSSESTADFYQRRADTYGDGAIANARSAPSVAGPMLEQAGIASVTAERERQRAHESRNDEFNRATQTKAAEIARIQVEADADKARSDADLNRETKKLMGQSVGTTRMDDSQKILENVILRGDSPQAYADAMMTLHMSPVASASEKGVTFEKAEPTYLKDKHNAYLREGYAAHAIHMLVASERFHEIANARPGDEAGIAPTAGLVGKDPQTGEPVEFTGDSVYAKSLQEQKDASMDKAIGAIVDGYSISGLMGRDWPTLSAAMRRDVFAPMEKYLTQQYLAKQEDRISALPKEFQEDARVAEAGRARNLAIAWQDFITEEMAIRNRALGGGTPENPNGEAWFTPSRAPANWSSRTQSMTDSAPQDTPMFGPKRMLE